ncbi:SixA phosphatase family protein [Parvibium lacunae]|uniref:Histidine phosphatase family protein n=1 Tax=Parvibium lacunae TaxID=1888893 RepID=A0A368L7L9_9BURK|nr:histidine phosphatase family protein [Parvibium lacunae]RCS59501.1 histidine phosphatase family protein [Parvibium lacunae]
MNLILWRHAEAEENLRESYATDLRRQLTDRGHKQAQKVAAWLQQHLPPSSLVIASPAIRTRQTASALTDSFKIDESLAPDADVSAVLAAADWPNGQISDKQQSQRYDTVVIVGHQPTLGYVASLLLAGEEQRWSIKKGAVWWLSARQRERDAQVVLRTVISPDFL